MKPGLRLSLFNLRYNHRPFLQLLSPPLISTRQSSALKQTVHTMRSHVYSCSVEAEPLHRYRPGGYHPVHLGDELKENRYKIIHKLGYGAYSTVWLARDQMLHRYVALKILIAESEAQDRELRILESLRDAPISSGFQHIERLLDDFKHTGPNGTHNCLILELLGPSVPTVIEAHFPDGRLPGIIANRVAMQVVLGLDFLHKNKIGHGDLHTGNVVFELPSLDSMSEEDLMKKMTVPETGPVTRSDGQELTAEVPRYLVWPTSLPANAPAAYDKIKIIDFGESFQPEDRPQTLYTPLVVRAPEVIFGDQWDHRVDLWSLGCMIFELVAGQPPFDSIMTSRSILISQMIDPVGALPALWQSKWASMNKEGQ
ncbi:kinase-like domain-containing protein [Delphinella strobiligena]|nr:kinase-like domain-containing protein [Delphinella strobiligena]